MTWFRINIGRERNADPRWLLPLICRAGGVTKTEIGAIRVDQRETRFQILAEVADQFDRHARTSKEKEGHIVRADSKEDVSVDEVSRGMDTVDGPPSQRSPETPRDRKPPSHGYKSNKGFKAAEGRKGGAEHKVGDGYKRAEGRKTGAEHKPGEGRKTGEGHKAPWRDRPKPEAGGNGWAARGRLAKKPGGKAPHPAAKPGEPGAARHASKYAKKRKHRPDAPAGVKA